MSQLILNFFQKKDSFGLKMSPVGHCNYEDHIEVDGKKAYDLLCLSNYRKKDLAKYQGLLKKMLRDVSSIHKITDTKPMTFCWHIGKQQYLSTSLFFEYYMATMANAIENLRRALHQETGNIKLYKEVKSNLTHLLGMFGEWKTQLMILPTVPSVVTPLFIKSLLCFTHGCHTLHVSSKLSGKGSAVAFATAMQSFGEVWPRHEYGNIALHQYLVSRVLLYNELYEATENASKKLTCLREVQKLLPYIKFQECYLSQSVLDKMKTIENENNGKIDDLINTHYAVEETLNDVPIPQTYKLSICKKTGQFGCKCKE